MVLALAGGALAGGAFADELGGGRLEVVGARLAVSPESQTVPFATPTVVETELTGWDPALGEMPAGLEVVGELAGPEINGALTLRSRPGEALRIPRLHLEGEYRLENLRLVQNGELLTYATPRDVSIRVTQVLVTRVTSRPLTLDEVRGYGVVLGDDSFQAFNFTFGFAVGGRVIDYNLPVLYNPLNANDSLVVLGGTEPLFGGSTGTTSPRFRPPRMAPFQLQLDADGGSRPVPRGGCQDAGGNCADDTPVVLPGVILFPSEVSLLHQMFSVVLVAKNDAPEGDPLVIRDLHARVLLPPALRMAETDPPTPLGVPVPVRVPGADGELGTGDDLTFLIAQAEGQAEVVVEGRQPGTHVVDFQLEGVLEGLPAGPQRISGAARGAVIVRDPTLAITISHPETVRADEEYSLFLTVTNTSNGPVNLASVALPSAGLSGVTLLSDATQTIPTLLPGEAEVVEFRLRSLRTGRVVASTVKTGSSVDPSFELTAGIGDAGIPLSPDSLILPRAVENLPEAVHREALGLLGLGLSLASAPEEFDGGGRPRLTREQLDGRAYWLTQAGRHVELGEDAFDSLAVLAAEWTGARDGDLEWDALRRITQRGGRFADAVGQTFATEAGATSPRGAAERFARTAAYVGSPAYVLAEGAAARLEVASRADGRRLARPGLDPTRLRELPFGELFDFGDGELALLAVPEEAGYQVRLTASGAGPGADALALLLPAAGGGLRNVRFEGLSLSPGGLVVVDFTLDDASFTALVDGNGDGLVDSQIAGVETTLTPRTFSALNAVQNIEADPSAHIVDVLLTQDVDLASLLPLDAGRFTIPGKVSNGGLVPVERDIANFFETLNENPFEGLRNSRVVQVVFDNPISPYVDQDLTVRDLASVTGQSLSSVTLPVVTTAEEPGTQVEGTVYGPDGQPVPFAAVELHEVDFFYRYPTPCRRHKTAAVHADSAGRFTFDYVRQTRCTDVFTLSGADPVSGQRGTARGRVRFVGGSQQVDVLMLGRGTVRGRLTYDDGSVPEDFRVVAYSPVFFDGREARVFPDGRYEVGDVPVGTVSLSATDRAGSFVYQTLEIPTAGAVVERDLVIVRQPPDTSTGDVRGTVVATDGLTPVFDAYLALYVDGELLGVERSGLEGSFDFGTVPTGRAEIEAFDGETGLSGAQLFFDVAADQVHDVTVRLSDERGIVEGHVTRLEPSGAVAVSGAVVWVSGTPFHTVTDSAGFYRLDGVFSGDRTVIAADLERQVQASAAVTVPNGGTAFRDLIFAGDPATTGGIAGEVLGFGGSPVSGAQVHIATGGGSWWREAITDSLGRFRFPDLGPGSFELHAVKGSTGASKVATVRFAGETPFVRLQFKKGTIRGTVRAEVAPGQTVGVPSLVTYRTSVVQEGLVGVDWEPRTLETAADGSFEIPDVLAGPYTLHVSNSFHGERTITGEILFHGEVHEHDVLFEQNGAIRGRVLDWDGTTPVEGARLELHHPALSLYDLESDEEGRFAFELVPPGGGRIPLDIEVENGSVHRRTRVWVRLNRFGQELDLDIVLPRQGTVSGFVEDASGNPVGGAVVHLTEHAFPGRRLTHNADGQGRFRFTNIFAGTVSLSAQAPSLGGLGGKATVELVAEGEEVSTLIQLEGTGEIVGRVLSPVTGEAVPSVQISLYRWGGGLFDSVTAAPDGTFRFRLLPLGQYRVWVFDPATGRHGQREGAWVEFNGHLREADVTLEVRGAVDGRLTDPTSGSGVPGATVRADVSSLVPFTTYSSTDVAGDFEFLGIPEGTAHLATREPAGRRRASGSGEVTFEGERVTVDLVLEGSGRVVGSVLAPPGAPTGLFPNGNVLIYQDGQVVGATLDNPFTFDGLIAGRTFRVEAREVGGAHRGEAYGALAGEGEEATIDVTMQALGVAQVTVRDSGGSVVPGADVTLWSTGYFGTERQDASTGPSGTATFQEVGAGHLSTWAIDPITQLGGSAEGTLTLESEVVPLEVALAPSGRVIGLVLSSDGVTPAEALVVLQASGRTLQAFTDGNGAFAFEAIPLGGVTASAQERFGPGSAQAGGSLTSDGQVVDLGNLLLDDADPSVVDLLPATGSADVPVAAALTIRFSESMDASRFNSGWIDFRAWGGAAVPYGVSWSENDSLLTVVPSASLSSDTGYQLTVEQAWDRSGRGLFERARTAFRTVDILPPTVVDLLPRNGDNQIDPVANLLVTFSEPVVQTSLSGSSFQLRNVTGGGSVAVGTTWQVLPGERQVRVTPVGGLVTDGEYTLTVQGAEDGSGNAMTTPVTSGFWTLDTIPPQITAVTFPAGTEFTAGDDLPVTIEATDRWGAAAARVRIATDSPGGWTFETTVDPVTENGPTTFEVVALAPPVETARTLTLTLEAEDVHGNVATTTRTVNVDPLVNGSSPEVFAECALDGDAVVPGREIEIAVGATDDQAVERLVASVDGVEIGVASPVNAETGVASFFWTPPIGAAAGTTYAVRLEARDFAGNVSVHDLTLDVPTGLVMVGGRSLQPADAGQDLTLAGGTFLVRDPLAFPRLRLTGDARIEAPDDFPDLALTVTGELRVQCGATIRHGATGRMDLTVPGTLVVGPGGSLDATALGFAGAVPQGENGQAPLGRTPSEPDAGGSHGGEGSVSSGGGPAGEIYDSLWQPTLAGGGGARHCAGGCSGAGGQAGGGVIAVTAGTLRLEGEIAARGGEGDSGQTGGAGGSVWVETGVLSGRGVLDASGGVTGLCSFSSPAGAGGGGRVSLSANSLVGSQAFDPVTQVFARGGSSGSCGVDPVAPWGGAGTAYAHLPGMDLGHLYVSNGPIGESLGRFGFNTALPTLGGSPVVGFSAAGSDAWVSVSLDLAPRWRGAWVELSNGVGALLGTFRVLEVDEAGSRLLLAGASAAGAAATFQGVYRFDEIVLVAAGLASNDPLTAEGVSLFDGGTLPLGLQPSFLELSGGTVEIADDYFADEVVVGAGTLLVPAAGRDAIRLRATGDLTLETGVVLDLDGHGYPLAGDTALSPPWVSAATGDAGGSHGGAGTAGNGGDLGEVYDSVYEPRLSGGAGPGEFAKRGGGVVVLEAGGTLTFEGEIRARGMAAVGHVWPAGAGGSVSLSGNVLQGAGTVDVSGGDSPFCASFSSTQVTGSGGGGRVAVHGETALGFDPVSQITAWGGLRAACTGTFPQIFAGPGTVLTRLNGQTYGTLRIDGGQFPDGTDRDGSTVELPTLGAGAVTAFAAEGANGRLTVDRTLQPRWLGAWMTLLDSSGADLGAFRVLEVDAVGAVLLEGASGAGTAATFRGEYRFDRLDLLAGAGVSGSDPILATEYALGGNVEVPGAIVADNLRILAGARVVPSSGQGLDFEIAGMMTVETGAVIDASGVGYPGGASQQLGGTAPTLTGAGYDTGGSHGGMGIASNGPGTPGEVFDSVYRPHLPGGGGGPRTETPSRAGGGAITIRAANLVLDGDIFAHGGEGTGTTGAGGSVLVEVTGTLSGAGQVEVFGGTQRNCASTLEGAGGGGRIALRTGTFAGFDPGTQARAWGGARVNCGNPVNYAGSGSVFYADAASTYGVLLLDNGTDDGGAARTVPESPLPALGAGSVSATEIVGSDLWVRAPSTFLGRWMGAWMALTDSGGASLGAFEVVAIDGIGRVLVADAASAQTAASYRGEYRFDRVDLLHGASLATSDPVVGSELVLEGDITVPSVVTADTLRIKAGAIIRPVTGSSLSFNVSGAFTVEAGAVIDVSGLGYPGGTEPSPIGGAPLAVSGSSGDAGGSHGGAGGVGDGVGAFGEVYGNLFSPATSGGGGGLDGYVLGSAGGGVVVVHAASMNLDGTIRANGAGTGTGPGTGGGGGTVSLDILGNLAGTGAIEASGGVISACQGRPGLGAGGGGRVAIRAASVNGFDPANQISAWGGYLFYCAGSSYHNAAPGTVYLHSSGATHGALRITSNATNGWPVPAATLTSIGRGVVGVATSSGADLWIEPEDPNQLFGLGVVGMWVRIDGMDYPVLAEDSNRRRLLLGGAAGSVAVEQPFVGIYKLDEVTVTGEADVVLTDGIETGALSLDPGISFTSLDLEAPTVALTAPIANTLFASGDTITATAQVSDNAGIASVTFDLEGQTFTDTEAPWEWNVAAPAVDPERDVVLIATATDLEGNTADTSVSVRVRPLAPGDAPTISILCPSPGALLAPGTGLDLHVAATHDSGIERVEIFLDGATTAMATDFDAPYVVRLTAPASATAGQILTARVRATSFSATTAELTLPVTVVEGNVLSGDTLIPAGDASLDGSSLIVADGTVTLEGAHSFEHLVVLDGATVSHSPILDAQSPGGLHLALTGNAFVACGGEISAAAGGLPWTPGDALYAFDGFDNGIDPASWTVVDAPGAGSSNWQPHEGHVIQWWAPGRSPQADGTHLRWEEPLPSGDYRVEVSLASGDVDDIGLLLRYQDSNNYLRFRWRRGGDAGRFLERVENGVVTILARDTQSYEKWHWLHMAVEAVGSSLTAYADGEVVLTATDSTFLEGTTALYNNFNQSSYFDAFRVSAPTDQGATRFVEQHFGPSGFEGWTVIDEAGAVSSPSNWWVVNGQLRQTSDIHRNPGAFGTYALPPTAPPGPDYRVRYRSNSSDDDYIGLMFRYRGPDDYYRFSWSRQDSVRRLERVVGGVVTLLASDSVSYSIWTWNPVEVEAVGPRLSVWVDGERVLTAYDETHSEGAVALYCSAASNTFFDAFVVTEASPASSEGGSHGGRGGDFLGGGAGHGSLFNPTDPGHGGGGARGTSGGGVVRLSTPGAVLIDGAVRADGAPAVQGPAGSGGSIRLDAGSFSGSGSISAEGGTGNGLHGGGGGGRVALYGATIQSSLLANTSAAGGTGVDATATGGAGTLFVKLDADPLGELVIDNHDRATEQWTELLALLPGTVTGADATSIADSQAAFPPALAGMDVFFNGLPANLWRVLTNTAQSIDLDVSQQPHGAQSGDAYGGLYRFDRVTVRGGARGIARNAVESTSSPQVATGSQWVTEYQPTLSLTSPTAGQVFAAGDLLTAAVSADDLLGVRDVAYEIEGERGSGSVSPYAWTWRVPPQAATQSRVLTATLTDRSGYSLKDSVSVTLMPSADAQVPAVSITSATPAEGATLTANEPVELDYSATDETRLWSFRLLVDGVELDSGEGLDATSHIGTLHWTMPGDPISGTVYTLRIEVTDYAGNLAYVERTVQAPVESVVTGDRPLGSSRNGTDLVLGTGTFTVQEPLDLLSLTLLNGATVTAAAGSSLDLAVSGELRIEAGGLIDMTGLGFAGGTQASPEGGAPAWVDGSLTEGGGSHGGLGLPWTPGTGVGGDPFDSLYRPTLGGGGGALDDDGSGDGGSGGGVVRIVAGTLVLDGVIRANGESSADQGHAGGAGGSLWITTGQLSGDGAMEADGGLVSASQNSTIVGAGGGGRIVLEVGTFAGFNPALQAHAFGNEHYAIGWSYDRCAATGTVYVESGGIVPGDLRVEHGSFCSPLDIPSTPLPILGGGALSLFEASGSDAWVSASTPFLPRWLGAWMVLRDSAGNPIGSFRVAEIDATGRALLTGASGASGVASYRGEYRFDEVVVTGGAHLVVSDPLVAKDLDVVSSASLPTEVTGDDVTVRSGGMIRSAGPPGLSLVVTDTLTIEAGGAIDTSGVGFAGGTQASPVGETPPGVVGSQPEAGGSHGGVGSPWSLSAGPAGEVYDSVYWPTLGGAGGPLDNDGSGDGGAGGGVLRIAADEIVLDGVLRSNGLDSNLQERAGGAGGTVVVEANTLSGVGIIEANGGFVRATSSWNTVGAGGGGRVRLQVASLVNFDPESQIRTWGHAFYSGSWGIYRCAGPGTAYVEAASPALGDLYVVHWLDCGTEYLPITVLPSIGTGTVGSVTADSKNPLDVWVTPQDPLQQVSLGVLGMHVRANGQDFRVIGEAGDRRTLLLAGAAGLVAVGDSYQGVYKFDTVTVRDGAILEFRDTAEVGSYDIDSASQVIHP